MFRRHAAREPARAHWQRDVSLTLSELGRIAKAEGDRATARRYFEESLEIRRRLAERDKGNTRWLSGIANSHDEMGDLALAEGDQSTAKRHYDECLKIVQALHDREPSNLDWQERLGDAQFQFGSLEMKSGRLAEARKRFETVQAIYRRVLETDPDRTRIQRVLAQALREAGDAAWGLKQFPAARTEYAEALAIRRRLAKRDPNNPTWQNELFEALGRLAATEDRLKRPAAAEKLYSESVPIAQRRMEADPKHPWWPEVIASRRKALGDICWYRNDFASALRHYEQSLLMDRRVLAMVEPTVSRRRKLALSLYKVGGASQRVGKLEEAVPAIREADAVHRGLLAESPELDKERHFWTSRYAEVVLAAGPDLLETGEDHLAYARAMFSARKFAASARHYDAALKDGAIRTAHARGAVYGAVRSHAFAGNEERAMELLATLTKRVRTQLGIIEKELRAGATPERVAYLAQFKKDRLSDIETIRSKDPALASLRKRKDFGALFETPAR